MTNLKSTLQNKTKQTRHAAMQHMVTAALFCAVLCVIAPITIPTPVGIGFTLGVLGIFLIGAFLPPLWAAGASLCYLVLGCIGLPVFSGWHGGADVLFGVTGGYLMAYVPMAAEKTPVARNDWRDRSTVGVLCSWYRMVRLFCSRHVESRISGMCAAVYSV